MLRNLLAIALCLVATTEAVGIKPATTQLSQDGILTDAQK